MTTAAAPKKEPFRRVSGDEQATRLIALYKRAEKEISTKLLQAVMKAGMKKALSVRRLEQELKAVYKMLDELKKAGESVSAEMVTAAFSGGIRVARKQLEAAGVIEKGTIVAEMGGVNEKAMKVYSSMIGERLADVVTTAGRTTADIYRQLELDSILTGTVSGYETINSKIREMEKTGEAQGLVAFVDRSGREWNMGTYVEMLARLQATRLRDVTNEEKMQDDADDSDALRERRDLERKDARERREERDADFLERRKAEINHGREMRKVVRDQKRQALEEDIEKWLQEEKEAQEREAQVQAEKKAAQDAKKAAEGAEKAAGETETGREDGKE